MPASLNSRTIWQIPSISCPSCGFPGAHRDSAQGIPPWEVLGSTHVYVCCVLAKEQGESSWDGAREQLDPYPPTRTPGRSGGPQSSVSQPPLGPQPELSPEPTAGRGRQHRDWLYHKLLHPYMGSLPPPASVSPSDKKVKEPEMAGDTR